MKRLKKILLIVGITIVVIVVALLALRTYTKSFSPAAVASFEQSGLKIEVKYCQPAKKGRQIFGNLVSFGKVWRTGANEATEITFGSDVKFGDKSVKADTYTLFTIPEKDNWTIILNSVLGQWGHFTYNEKKDVVRIVVPAKEGAETIEKFTISIKQSDKGALMELAWDKTKVIVPIEKQ